MIKDTIIPVRRIHIHPQWKSESKPFNSDIAVLVLNQAVKLNEFIQPADLFDLNLEHTNPANGSIISYGSSESPELRFNIVPKIMNIPIYSYENCINHKSYLKFIMADTNFCGGGEAQWVGICDGDDGSGVFVTDGTKVYLYGIVPTYSHSNLCENNQFSIFVGVQKFTDWIRNIKHKSRPTSSLR